jgi:hypothetical protein
VDYQKARVLLHHHLRYSGGVDLAKTRDDLLRRAVPGTGLAQAVG